MRLGVGRGRVIGEVGRIWSRVENYCAVVQCEVFVTGG